MTLIVRLGYPHKNHIEKNYKNLVFNKLNIKE